MNGAQLIKSTIHDEKGNGLKKFVSPSYYLSLVYGLGVALRRAMYKLKVFKSRSIDAFVISVGNIVVGGSGKTPTVIYLAKLLQSNGHKVCVLSRGYKGTNQEEYLEVSDENGVLSDPVTAGDEPYMMAKKLVCIPVIVGRDRYKAGKRAVEKFKPDVCILDDGFQHLRLKRDLDIVTFDGDVGTGNSLLLPAGILREHLCALKRADAFLINKGDKRSSDITGKINKYKGGDSTVFFCGLKAEGLTALTGEKEDISFLSNKRAFVFSALANAESLYEIIRENGALIAGTLEYDDHHYYDTDDYDKIVDSAKRANADIILSTEKDLVKLKREWIRDGKIRIFSLDVKLVPKNESEISELIWQKMKERNARTL